MLVRKLNDLELKRFSTCQKLSTFLMKEKGIRLVYYCAILLRLFLALNFSDKIAFQIEKENKINQND